MLNHKNISKTLVALVALGCLCVLTSATQAATIEVADGQLTNTSQIISATNSPYLVSCGKLLSVCGGCGVIPFWQ
jgi:hypothetical protein